MPYIEEKDREELEPAIRAILAMLKSRKPRAVAGMLNYVISKIVWSMWTHDKCYDTGNTLIGALECAKTEFARRKLAPYEDDKMEANGDVYPI